MRTFKKVIISLTIAIIISGTMTDVSQAALEAYFGEYEIIDGIQYCADTFGHDCIVFHW